MADKKSQKAYNDELKQTRSLIGEIQSAMDALTKASDKRNKTLANFVSNNKKILGDLTKQKQAEEKIANLTGQRGVIESKHKVLLEQKNSVLAKAKKLYGDAKADALEEAKSIQKQIDKTEERLSKVDELISKHDKVLKGELTEENLQQKINDLTSERFKMSNANFGINSKLKDELIGQNIAAEGILQNRLNEQKILSSVNNKVDGITQGLTNQLDTFSEFLEKIPVVGGLLSGMFEPLKQRGQQAANAVGDSFKEGFGKSFMDARKKNMSFSKSFTNGLKGGTKAAMKMAKTVAGILGPIGIAVLAVAAAFAIGLKSFQELDEAAKSFRTETGLLNSQTGQLSRNIASTRMDFVELGVSAQDVAKAAADFTNEFDGLEQPSQAVLGSMVMMNKNFGIGTAEATKLNKVFQNIGGLSAEQSQYLIGQTAEMARMAGVAPQKVIKDMADSSEYAYKYFQGSPEELAKAAVQAAKLGTSIAEAGKVADGLLNFQNSISSELKAQAMLGTNLNFSQARYLAANGDILGSQQAIIDQVQKNVDLTNLNTYEQQALAEATGMEFSSLKNQVRIREKFGKLSEEQLAAATSLLDTGKDISEITASDLRNQSARLKAQEGLASSMDKFKNATGAIGASIGDAFRPVAEFLMPLFTDIASMAGKVLIPAFKLIGKLLSIVFGVLKPIFTFVFAIGKGVFGLLGGLIEILVNGFGYVADIIGSIGDWIQKNIIIPIEKFFGGIASVIGRVGGLLGFGRGGGGSDSTQESVNDGVMQNGKVITTDPADFLLATKNPGALAQEVGGGGGVSVDMSGVIMELQSLKEAFLSNKDVYMDNTLVTAKVTTTQDRSGRTNSFGINKG